MQHYYLPPLKINFSENEPLKIQIMRVGSFYDERYGKVDITSAHLVAMTENFNKNVRGVDIALDFSHETDGPAAGWIKRIELNQDQTEMWAEIDWTNAGKENLLGKEYRYVSPDFTFEYKDNETLKAYGPVLLGAGLTNRPVIKNMAPAISLKEVIYKQGETMTPEEIKAMQDENAALKAKIAELEKAAPKELEAAPAAAPAAEADLKKMCSDQGAKIMALEAALADKKAEVAMAEKAKTFDIMLSEGKVVEAQRDAFIAGDMTLFLSKAMPVKMTEIGNGGGGKKDETTESPSDKVMKLTEAHTSKGKSVSEAIKLVLRENVALRKEYENEVKFN